MAHLKCSVEKKQNCELLTLLKSVWVFTSLQNGDTDIFSTLVRMILGLPSRCSGKESACQCRRLGFDPWVGKILWRTTHPSTLAWEIPWTEEPGELQSMGSQSWTRPSTYICTGVCMIKSGRDFFLILFMSGFGIKLILDS